MKVILAILWKDLVSEWRARDRVLAMLVFSLLVVVAFHFALPDGTAAGRIEGNAAGLLWVAYIFASLLGLNRSFAQELENDALSGLALAPVDRGTVFVGKAAANVVLTGVVQALVAFVFALVFDLDWVALAPRLAGVVALGTLGICSVGTLFSAMAVRTRFREVLLPILLLPALFPVLAGCVRGTQEVIAGARFPSTPSSCWWSSTGSTGSPRSSSSSTSSTSERAPAGPDSGVSPTGRAPPNLQLAAQSVEMKSRLTGRPRPTYTRVDFGPDRSSTLSFDEGEPPPTVPRATGEATFWETGARQRTRAVLQELCRKVRSRRFRTLDVEGVLPRMRSAPPGRSEATSTQSRQ